MSSKLSSRYPKLHKQFNAEATDCGSTEYAKIAAEREDNMFLLWIKDIAHSADTVDKTALRETYGTVTLTYGKGCKVRRGLISAMIKLTVKDVFMDKNIKAAILSYSKKGEFITVAPNCGTRMRSTNISATSMFSKRKVKTLKIPVIDVDDDKEMGRSSSERGDPLLSHLLHDLHLTFDQPEEDVVAAILSDTTDSDLFDVVESKHAEEAEMKLPTLSADLFDKFDEQADEAHDRAARLREQRGYDLDVRIYESGDGNLSYFRKDRVLDLKKHVIMVNAAMSNDEFLATHPNGKKWLDFWTNRVHIASVISTSCVNNKCSSRIIDLMDFHFNRWIELVPLIGEVLRDICRMQQCAAIMISKFDVEEIIDAVDAIEELYTLSERKRCARLVNCSGNISACYADASPGKMTCEQHLHVFDDVRLDLLVSSLPSKMDKHHEEFLSALYRNIFDFDEKFDGEDDVEQFYEFALRYFGPVLRYTSSELFEQFSEIDGLETRASKAMIYTQLFKYMTIYKYKFVERMLGVLEGGLCICAMLSHPDLFSVFARNIAAITLETWVDRTCVHLQIRKRMHLKKRKKKEDPEEEQAAKDAEIQLIREFFVQQLRVYRSQGRNGGVSYACEELWALICSPKLIASSDRDIIETKEFEALHRWIEPNVVALNQSMPVESMMKSGKASLPQQTISESTINNTWWPKFNLKNVLHHHPRVLYDAVQQMNSTQPTEISQKKPKKKKLRLPALRGSNANSDQVQAFEVSEESYAPFRKAAYKAPPSFEARDTLNPNLNKGRDFDAKKAIDGLPALISAQRKGKRKRMRKAVPVSKQIDVAPLAEQNENKPPLKRQKIRKQRHKDTTRPRARTRSALKSKCEADDDELAPLDRVLRSQSKSKANSSSTLNQSGSCATAMSTDAADADSVISYDSAAVSTDSEGEDASMDCGQFSWKNLTQTAQGTLRELKLSPREWHMLLEPDTMLIDSHIHAAHILLKQQFPGTDGCQTPLLIQNQTFERIRNEGAQLLHCGSFNHWMCTKQFIGDLYPVLFDSAFTSSRTNLTNAIKISLGQLFRGERAEHVRYRYAAMQQQTGGTVCGLMAIAVMTDLLFKNDPELIHYDQKQMRDHFINCCIRNRLVPFPRTQGECANRCKKSSGSISLMSCCRLPQCYDKCVKCTNKKCRKMQHRKCIGWNEMSKAVRKSWRCSACSENDST